MTAKRRPSSRKRRGLPRGPRGGARARGGSLADFWRPQSLGDGLLLTVLALAMVFGTVAVVMVLRTEIVLDLHHNLTSTAVIDEVRAGTRTPGTLLIHFNSAGRNVSTVIDRRSWNDHLSPGQKVTIEYDSADPSIARLAGDHAVTRLALILAFGAAIFFALTRLERWRRTRRAPTARP